MSSQIHICNLSSNRAVDTEHDSQGSRGIRSDLNKALRFKSEALKGLGCHS